VRFGAVKLIADGSIQGYTAYLREPYFVPPGDDPAERGYPRYPKQELAARVAGYRDAGLQVAIHANGDAAIDDALDALESAQAGDPELDARPVIIHAQMTRPDQLERMKRLRVIPSFFVLHSYYWGDRHRERFLGPERAARISPTHTAQQTGVRFTLHCDTPVVPMEPLRLVWAAVNRRTTSGQELGPEERIDVTSALRAVTIDAAFQHFEEDLKGSLEPGKLADLVILARSPLAEPAEGLASIPVLETIVGGESVWSAP
jgi:predicted amidohydrolase YtcJ